MSSAENYQDLQELFAEADKIRRQTVGDVVYLRGIIEFSNYCRCNCLYCGLRRDNETVHRYRMPDEEILATAAVARAAGADTVVLQSGEDPHFSGERMAGLVSAIKGDLGLAVTISAGNRSSADYALWKKAGADRYLLKHETSDPELYAAMHPGEKQEARLDALKRLRDLGFEVGTGFIIGLPGQTDEIIERDIELVKELGADMCGVGPFIPQANTPLAGYLTGNVKTTLRTVARLRLACPRLNLPATTALATLDNLNGQLMALRAGANVIMPSFTPPQYGKDYRIYDGKTKVGMPAALEIIAAAGRKTANGLTAAEASLTAGS